MTVTVVMAPPPVAVKPVVKVRVDVGLDCNPAFPELLADEVPTLDVATDVLIVVTDDASVVSVANCKLVFLDRTVDNFVEVEVVAA